MTRSNLITAALLLLAVDSAATAAKPEHINVDQLGRLPAFSHATVAAGGMVFVSGTLGTGEGISLVEGGIAAQTEQTLRNIETILTAAGSSLGEVLKCTVFLADMSDFTAMNEVWMRVFGSPPPARSTVGVGGLALGALVEIECIAQRDGSP